MRYEQSTIKRAQTILRNAGVETRTVEAAPVKKAAKLPVWALAPKARQARYDSQPTYWAGLASAKQRERCEGKLPRKATSQDAAEMYARIMCAEHGMKFQPLP
jgi:hypothetical protein